MGEKKIYFVGEKMLFKLNSDSLMEFWDKIIHVSREKKNDNSVRKEWHTNNINLSHLIIMPKIKTFDVIL